MTATFWFDSKRVKEAIRSGMEDGLDEVADRVAGEAKRRAPIRKVFKEKRGFRRRTRALTDQEKVQAIARAMDYYTKVQPNEYKRRRAVAHIRFYARVALPTRGSANAVGTSMKMRTLGYKKAGRFTSTSGAFPNRMGGYEPSPEVAKAMTSRGRYEVRSGRAIHEAPSAQGTQARVQVGGALKASIGNKGVTETPGGVKATVAADIEYAKFVEFPTIRTKAQPFLLPALHDERGKIVGTIAAAIRKNLGG